ncbi:MAG: DNA cytosine methyltransferase [Desulfobacterales bacterium]|nr:DNA cytosine methyltransferase [Desulfobacterales bacterium]
MASGGVIRGKTQDPFLGVDLFCGAGGTSTALIEAGEEAGVDVQLTAINHWDKAIETHTLNHPRVKHLCENLDNVNPRKLYPGGRINLLIASPECTHHSNARGGTPCSDQSRATAWRIVDWASALYIDGILVENVPEFMSWGPLGANGKPMKSKKGETFKAFIIALKSLGYRVEYRVINTADYGDPTCRKRFFLLARRGNKKIRWPGTTHAERSYKGVTGKEIRSWVPAREIIDWSIPGKSIFKRKKPLAKKTLARIEYGLQKFGGKDFLVKFFGTGKSVSMDKPLPTVTATGQHIGVCEPFVTIMKGQSKSRSIDHPLPTLTTKPHMYLCEPFLIDRNYTHAGPAKVRSLDRPAPTLTTRPGQALVEPFLVGIDHASAGHRHVRSLDKPTPTIVTQQNYALIEPFLIKYFGTSKVQSLNQPLGTVTTKDRFALVELFRDTPGLDIRLRMLQPNELALAQSFPPDYRFAGTKGDVVKQIGNAVPRRTAKALIREMMT